MKAFVFAALCAASGIAHAQSMAPIYPAPAASVAPVAIAAPNQAMLRVGTEVPLRLLEELTTKGIWATALDATSRARRTVLFI